MTLRVAVLASGRGSNLMALLAAIDAGRVDATVNLVVSDQVDAPCLDKAAKAGVAATVALPIEAGETRGEYDVRLAEVLRQEAPDLVVLAGFMRILTAGITNEFQMVNVHPALLPSFKGAHGIRDTLAAGAKLAGCTTHFVTADLDGGPILLQAATRIQAGETHEHLAARVLRAEHQLLPRTVQLIAQGRVVVANDVATIAPGDHWADQELPDFLYSDGF